MRACASVSFPRCRSGGASRSNGSTALAAHHRRTIAPARTAEYLFYQTLLAAHPIDADRAWAYMLKAAREAKADTSWIEPNQAYEADLEQFVRGMIADPNVEAEIAALLASMTPAWQMLSLSQTLIKLTAPGVPDIYQGSELWDLRLVDPDNRTPVDYAVRRDLLGSVSGPDRGDFLSGLELGAPKLRTHRDSACGTRAPRRGVRRRLGICARGGERLQERSRDLLRTHAGRWTA